MNFFACWHRPGPVIRGDVHKCRHCGVAIEECPCVEYRISKLGSNCPACEGSHWVGIIRSKRDTLKQALDLAAL